MESLCAGVGQVAEGSDAMLVVTIHEDSIRWHHVGALDVGVASASIGESGSDVVIASKLKGLPVMDASCAHSACSPCCHVAGSDGTPITSLSTRFFSSMAL